MPGLKKTKDKGVKITNAQVRPSSDVKQVEANLGFNSPIGNSQINGFLSQNQKQLGFQHTYPISNIGTGLFVTGGGNYSTFNYPQFQGSDLSGNLGMNYKRSFGKNKNTDIDLTASLDLNKEGISPGFNIGLVRRFPNGGVITEEEDPLAALNSSDISKFMFDSRQNTFKSDPFAQFKANVQKCGKNKSCAEGAFNYWANYLSPYLHQPAIRDIHNQYVNIPEDAKLENPQFSMKSRPRTSFRERLHNQSLDSWELYNLYNKTDAGNVFWDGKKQGEFKFTPENLKNIPIGAIITQGKTEGSITAPGNPQSSHTTTVVGFDHDGHPLIYDDGQVHRLGESWHYQDVNDTYTRVNDIFIPKGYQDFTYSKMKDRDLQYKTKLGYTDKEGNPATNDPNRYSRFYINDIKNSLDKNEAIIGNNYNISKEFMDKIQNRVIGLGAKESNFNNFGDIKQADGEDPFSWKQQYGDSEPVNLLVKPVIKSISNKYGAAIDKIMDSVDDREQKDNWEIEILLEKALQEEGKEIEYGSDEWNKAYNELRKKYDKKSEQEATSTQQSSRGPFKIKDFPESATKLLKDEDGRPLDKGDLTLWGEDVNELRYGANVAAIHLIENINKFKKKYADKNLTDDQLLDLATVAYNNQGKSMSSEFVDKFIKENYLKDAYLENVKRFQKLYLEQETEENSDIDASSLNLFPNAAAISDIGAAQNRYGGPIVSYANGGTLMPYMFPQQMKGGGQFWSKFGAGATGALQGVAGSLLPGKVGDLAVKGIGAVHGMIDKDITDADRAIMGGARAVGAGVTAVATGGATLAAGADDMVLGTKDAIKSGTEWGQKNAAALDTVGNIAGMAASGAAGGAADGGGMKGAGQGLAKAFGVPTKGNVADATAPTMATTGIGDKFTGGTGGAGGGFTGQTENTMDNGKGMNVQQLQQMLKLAKQFGLMQYGGPIQMAQGGFKPHPMYKDGQMVMANDYETHLRLKEAGYGHEQMKNGGMIKRADGSYSQRGLWDNIRANKGSGNKPTKEMLAQERKIKSMANGGLTSIETGGTHEQNPMGGVPVGPNALVEEGETIMDLKDQVEGGKFVFSDRRGPKGKKGSTWADISKRIERKYKDREGDAAAKRAMDQELLEIAEKQEAQKAKEMEKLQAKMDDISGEAPAGPSAMPALPPTIPGGIPQGPQGMPQQPMPMSGQTPPMPQMAKNGGVLYSMGGMTTGQMPMQPNMNQGLSPDMMQAFAKMGQQPMQPMQPMPGGPIGANPIMPMGYGGIVKKKYEMGGPIMYPGGGILYSYGGKLNIPQEDIDYIEQIIDFELAHGSPDGTGLSYGAWSKNQASDRDSAIEFIYNKYVTPNKDLPVNLRKRAVDMHLNSEDPRASLMVAAGLITPSEKIKLYNIKNPDTGKGMINPDDLDKLWNKHKDKVEAKYSDPKFVKDFDKEKHRSYSGLGDMYKNSHKYRIDMWNPKATNYRNPANYKNTDYDGGQPTIGTAQFGTKAQDTKQSLNTALGMDDASKAQTAAELDQRRAEMTGTGTGPLLSNNQNAPGFLSDNFTSPFLSGNLGNVQPTNTQAPADTTQGGQYVDPLTGERINYDPYAQEGQGSDDMPDFPSAQSAISGQPNNSFLNQDFTQPTYEDITPPRAMDAIPTGNIAANNLFDSSQNLGAVQDNVQPTAADPWDNLFNNLDDLTIDKMKQIATDNDLPWENLKEEAAKRGLNLGDIGGAGKDNADSFGSMSFNELIAARDRRNQPLSTDTNTGTEQERGVPISDLYEGLNPGSTAYVGGNNDPNRGTGYYVKKREDTVDNFPWYLGGNNWNNQRPTDPPQNEEEESNLARNASIWGGQALNSMGDFWNLARGLQGPDDIRYDRVDPNLVNLEDNRRAAREASDTFYRNTNEGMKGQQNIHAAITTNALANQNLGNQLGQSYTTEENLNAQILNNAEQVNQQIDQAEKIAQARAKSASDNLIAEGLHGIGGNAAQGLLDVRTMNADDRRSDRQMNAMNEFLKDFKINPDGTVTFG